jgi:hypothetical protein
MAVPIRLNSRRHVAGENVVVENVVGENVAAEEAVQPARATSKSPQRW